MKLKKLMIVAIILVLVIDMVAGFGLLGQQVVHAAARPAADAGASVVRVKLSTGNVTEISLTISGAYSIDSGKLNPGTYRVRNEGSMLGLLDSEGNMLARTFPTLMIQENATGIPSEQNSITMRIGENVRQYQGSMKFWANGAFVEAVNHIYLEKYLYGVVGYEMSNGFPLEALKSQAVAARCYVVKRLDRTRGERYDIGDTSSDQVYKGYNASYTRVIQAVDATAGRVLQYNGSIITAYYSASNGGQTERSENVWTAAEPFLKIRNDPYDLQNPSSLKRTVSFPKGTHLDKAADGGAMPVQTDVRYSEDDMDARLVDFLRTMAVKMLQDRNAGLEDARKFAIDPATIRIKAIDSLQAIQTSASPYCKHDALSTDGPPHDAGNCPSIDFTGARMTLLLKVTQQNPAAAGGQERIDYPWSFEFIIPDYLRSTANPQWYVFDSSYNLRIYAVESGTSASGVPAFNLVARRFGHGIGLSQRGAQQRALDPDPEISNYERILAFYYPGTALTATGLTEPVLPAAPGAFAPELRNQTPGISYQSHVQDIGWQGWVANGSLSGAIDQSRQIEALRVRLDQVAGNVEYSTFAQGLGWLPYTMNGVPSGTQGQARPVEAVRMRLSGEAAQNYDIYYRACIEKLGWLGWAKNDQPAGTGEYGYRLEAIQVQLVRSGEKGPDMATEPYLDVRQKVNYQSNVQDLGWLNWVSDGALSGTSGQSKRLESMRIKLGNVSGGIEYRTHVQDLGWLPYVSNGELSGTEGQSKRLEAINIRLTGEAATQYDIYYRVHAQEFGWLDWAKNDQPSGTAGFSYRLEAIEIRLVPRGGAAPGPTTRTFVDRNAKPASVAYQSHVQDIGWQGWMLDGALSGTSGQSKRLESMRIKLENIAGGIEYRTHVQDLGWLPYVSNGELSGTEGQSKRLEAINIRLTGEAAALYDVYYRVHAQEFGWLDWAKNDQPSGTAGFSYRLEAIEIRLVPKNGAAPGPVTRTFVQK